MMKYSFKIDDYSIEYSVYGNDVELDFSVKLADDKGHEYITSGSYKGQTMGIDPYDYDNLVGFYAAAHDMDWDEVENLDSNVVDDYSDDFPDELDDYTHKQYDAFVIYNLLYEESGSDAGDEVCFEWVETDGKDDFELEEVKEAFEEVYGQYEEDNDTQDDEQDDEQEGTDDVLKAVRAELVGKKLYVVSPQLNGDGWHDHAEEIGWYNIVRVKRFGKAGRIDPSYFQVMTEMEDEYGDEDIKYFIYNVDRQSFLNIWYWDGDDSKNWDFMEDSIEGYLSEEEARSVYPITKQS